MILEKLSLAKTQQFDPIFLDYLAGKPELTSFYHRPPQLASFSEQIAEKQLSSEQRAILVEVLQQQYQSLNVPAAVSENIQRLADGKTFTVTTGHQLNIFTGPLYFIYKIVTVINACRALKEAHPDYTFVPVYWMASEDHDFEEISYFNLFGKTYTWETDQRGAVGRFHLNGLGDVLDKLPEKAPIFEEAYREQETLADAVRYYVNALFGEQGLVVLDADDAQLKSSFITVMKDDLLNHTAKQKVEETSAKLEELDYKTQVFPREINLFYLREASRERIVREEEKFQALNTDYTFSEEELLQELREHPERFSPNVILRPLYQEVILPNLAYVGGPSELSYWLQLKPVFDHYEVAFPILMPRNFALVINKTNAKKLHKVGVSVEDLFLDAQSLVKKFVEDNASASILLKEEKAALAQVFEKIKEKVRAVDGSLEGFIGSEANQSFKSLSNIEKRLKKAEEQNQATSVKQLEGLKEKLFPAGVLQERKENFLNFYLNNYNFIDELLAVFSPFDFQFHILSEGEDR
ncbi:bacillithiol biosynthesis cysteine-adding enzyme BshC [Tunicatimonas pelagia]|uniref:bacillithiol biosynthesis cysteine-adding enzyme BshC n=1 Tax=Tunicatimonas pelagia TaxID=931531 RepID=UPI0026654A84|nr:bacillithiol biosynthesis cysteine-adding enzyme BshC [Tunicatimonas pelagia]WKN41604.1 bacillithiol biosynthesis cysteine-adding enzyme BshC [Tunicatimonas pelagia]